MKSIFYFVTRLENINQCILSVKLSSPQIFLFEGQAWKHDSMQIVVTAIIKTLSKIYFLFCGSAWKCFVMHIVSYKWTAIIFVWWSSLKTLFHGDYWLQQYIYLLYKYHTLESKHFLFYGLAWKHFAVHIIRQPSLMVWHKKHDLR